MRAGSQPRPPYIFAVPMTFSRLRHAFFTASARLRRRSCKLLSVSCLLSDSPLGFAALACSYLELIPRVQRICSLAECDPAVADCESAEGLDGSLRAYRVFFSCHRPSRGSQPKPGCTSLLIFDNAELASGCVRVPRHCEAGCWTFTQALIGHLVSRVLLCILQVAIRPARRLSTASLHWLSVADATTAMCSGTDTLCQPVVILARFLSAS